MQNVDNILLLFSGKFHVPDKFSSACSVGLAYGWAQKPHINLTKIKLRFNTLQQSYFIFN